MSVVVGSGAVPAGLVWEQRLVPVDLFRDGVRNSSTVYEGLACRWAYGIDQR